MEYNFFKDPSSTAADELRKVLPVNVNVSLETLAPALRGAVKDYAEPVLGEDMLKHLQYYYDDRLRGFVPPTPARADGHWTASSDLMNTAILELQSALLRLAYYDSFAQLAVMISDTGLSDQQGEQRVYRYQADALRRSLRQQGAKRLNALLLHCEANEYTHPDTYLDANNQEQSCHSNADYRPFSYIQSSDLYSLREKSFIRDTSDFQKLVDISSDALLFHTLRPYITRAEQVELVSRVGENNVGSSFALPTTTPTTFTLDILAAALRQCQSSTSHQWPAVVLDEDKLKPIAQAVQRFVAFWAVADALPIIGCRVTPDGALRIADSLGSGAQSGESLADATPAQLTALTARYRQQAEEEIGFAIRLMKSAALRSFFSQEALGPGDDHHRSLRRDNRNKRTFLA